jgi:hypothetical protein
MFESTASRCGAGRPRHDEAVADCLELEDRHPRLEVGRLHVHDQAGPEAAAEPLLDPAELLGRPVGRDHDLPLVLVQVVERVEELGLRLFCTSEELHVVEEQHVDVAVLPLEEIPAAVAHRADELGHEALARDVAHAHARVEPRHVRPMANRRWVLPRPAAVDEQRVVDAGGRGFGHGHRGRVRELVLGPGTNASNV